MVLFPTGGALGSVGKAVKRVEAPHHDCADGRGEKVQRANDVRVLNGP